MVSVIDYGIGNVASVINMLKKVGTKGTLLNNPAEISRANKIILPGVGAFDSAMSALAKQNLITPIQDAVANGAYLMGICLGAQLLLDDSEEGDLPGLGIISGSVKKFQFQDKNLRVPHMGWNVVYPRQGSKLFELDAIERRFYFVHSYYISCSDGENVLATCDYGGEFACCIEKNRVMGVQFHPEKSHRFGMEMFQKFVALEC